VQIADRRVADVGSPPSTRCLCALFDGLREGDLDHVSGFSPRGEGDPVACSRPRRSYNVSG
jgi:hypothetical protein